jgi:gas vesicle protein
MAWYNKHRVLTGVILGFTAGSVVPGLGNLVGAVAGAIVAPMIIEEETKDK